MNLSIKTADRIYLFLCYTIIFGVTLLFSTATRSVFEVNKLGLVKISLSLLGIMFFYDQLFGNKQWFFEYKKTSGLTTPFYWLRRVILYQPFFQKISW